MSIIGHVTELWRYPVKSMGGESLPRATVGPLGIPGDRGWALRDEAAGEMRGAKKMPVLMQCRARYDAEPNGAAIPPVTMTLPDGSTLHSGDADAAARLSTLTGRTVTLWPLQPAEQRDHYRRGLPDSNDMETELRQVFGRLPDEPLPDLSAVPPEIFEFTSPLGTYFDVFPLHLLTTATLRALAELNPTAQFATPRFRPNVLIEPSAGGAGLVEQEWQGRRVRIGGATVAIAMPTMRCSMTTHAVGELPKDASVLRTIVRDAKQNVGVYATIETAGAVAVGDAVELL
ncbi:MAG: MOSC domain-containing protein [Candidatus Binatia bacterium]